MTYNKSKKSRTAKKTRGGGCGCAGGNHSTATTSATTTPTSFSFFKGGSSCGSEPPSFSNVPLKSFYGGKDESANPLYAQVASRLLGGKKSKKNASKKNKSKKMKKKNNRKLKGGLGLGFMNSDPEFKLLPVHTMV
jgi:hypothetical protein